jgi:predicted choloylglycine hydrolase
MDIIFTCAMSFTAERFSTYSFAMQSAVFHAIEEPNHILEGYHPMFASVGSVLLRSQLAYGRLFEVPVIAY